MGSRFVLLGSAPDASNELIAVGTVYQFYITIFCHHTWYARTKSSVRHRLGAELRQLGIARVRVAHQHFLDSLTVRETAWVHNLYAIIEHQQTNGGRFQQVEVYQRILYQLFQDNFWDFQYALAIERLTVLRTPSESNFDECQIYELLREIQNLKAKKCVWSILCL